MNYNLDNLPFSGMTPRVILTLAFNDVIIGDISILLYRDVFPAGVENFVLLALGTTSRITDIKMFNRTIQKATPRTYVGSKFYRYTQNRFIIGGDIYRNNGTSSGTIYNDMPIPSTMSKPLYSHTPKGMLSLVSYNNDVSGAKYFDSTFMITLVDSNDQELINKMDNDNIVIGRVTSGYDVLDKINMLIAPSKGKFTPNITIYEAKAYTTVS